MKKSSLVILCFVLLGFSGFTPRTQDVFDEMAHAFKTGNAHAVSIKLSDPVELDIEGTDEVYSRNQAEMILKDFMAKNPIKNVVIQHRGNSSGGARFANGIMETTKGNFRLHILARQTPTGLFASELRIEHL